jgi:Spy/CpxP family protein refolding chaperone
MCAVERERKDMEYSIIIKKNTTMKANKLLVVAMMAILTSTAVMAQQGRGTKGSGQSNGQGPRMEQSCPIPDLTAEQQTQLETMRVAHQKQLQPLKNKMQELKARQNTLETADKAEMKAINANIDEMTKLQNQMMKAKAEHRQQVRAILTDSQKLWFDNHQGKRGGKGYGRGQGKGFGNGPGNAQSCNRIG